MGLILMLQDEATWSCCIRVYLYLSMSLYFMNLTCIGLWINHSKCGILDYFGVYENKDGTKKTLIYIMI